MKGVWQLQEAKNKLSQVVDKAVSVGPQIITRHGSEVAVVLSYAEYVKVTSSKQKISTFFKESPLADIKFDRDHSALRKIDGLL
jgi:prevent-host-death family protein